MASVTKAVNSPPQRQPGAVAAHPAGHPAHTANLKNPNNRGFGDIAKAVDVPSLDRTTLRRELPDMQGIDREFIERVSGGFDTVMISFCVARSQSRTVYLTRR